MKPTIRITLFGRFAIRVGRDAALDQVPHKAQELLAYLILHRGRSHPRESVAEVLWHEHDSPHSRKYLRQVLWQLHAGLVNLGRRRAAQLLRADTEWLEFALGDGVSADIVDFESAFQPAKSLRGESLGTDLVHQLVEAAQLYRGDLLEGVSADWCLYDRDRFRRMYLSILDKLADFYESRHEYEAALAYGTMALRHDRVHERGHRGVMRVLAEIGDRAGALRQYRRCEEVLRDDLGVEPEPETAELYARIRACEVVGARRERLPFGVSARAARGRRPLGVVGGEPLNGKTGTDGKT